MPFRVLQTLLSCKTRLIQNTEKYNTIAGVMIVGPLLCLALFGIQAANMSQKISKRISTESFKKTQRVHKLCTAVQNSSNNEVGYFVFDFEIVPGLKISVVSVPLGPIVCHEYELQFPFLNDHSLASVQFLHFFRGVKNGSGRFTVFDDVFFSSVLFPP